MLGDQILIKDLRTARRQIGLTQSALASRVGGSPQMILRLEQGVGSVATLVAVMKALDFRLTGPGPGAIIDEQLRNRRLKQGWTLERLRDPGMPIPKDVTRLTGISDADVAGALFDAEDWTHLFMECDLLVAHNAAYDAVVLERLLPGIRGRDWACSMSEIDWAGLGFDGRSLGYLLTQIGFFNKGHRAMADVTSLVHLLFWQAPDGRCLLAHLRDRADRVTIKVEALNAPFSRKDLLKARGYKWNAKRRVWWAEIEDDALEEEKRWLTDEVRCTPSLELLTSAGRHR